MDKGKKEKFGKIASIASGTIVALLTLIKESAGLKDTGFVWAFWVIFGIAVAVLLTYATYLIVTAIRNHKRNKNLVNTSSILERSRRVSKDIKKVITLVEKTIKKYVEKHDTLDKERKQQLEELKKSILYASRMNRRKKQVAREISYFKKLSSKTVIKEIDNSDYSHEDILLLNQSVLNSIKEMNRALLVLEQYDTRIYLGKYVLKHSSNVYDCADALIDYKGWTYALIGKREKFQECVKNGIKLLDDYRKGNELEDEEKEKVHFKLARAYRHLGSEVVTAKHDSDKAKEYNNQALEELKCFDYLDEKSIKEAYEEHKNKELYNKKMEQLRKVEEMRVGIEYGILNANYFIITNRKSNDKGKELAKELLKCISDARGLIERSKSFSNPHRYLKCILLQNEFLKLLEPTLSEEVQEEYKSDIEELFGKQKDIKKYVCKLFDDNTAVVDDVFRNAIYADEMMEIYINQEATQLFRIIKEIGE